MGFSVLLSIVLIYAAATAAQDGPAAKSAKRGLIYIPPASGHSQQDDPLLSKDSSLTWYYNYNPGPNTTIANASSPLKLEFVPQLWGANNDNGGTAFSGQVEPLLDDPANKITSMLFMNEPDLGNSGGSGVDPGTAAKLWQDQFASLKEKHSNLQLGSPAVSNAPEGFNWLAEWFAACDNKCQPDFMAVHYYGPYDGFVQHIQQVNSTFGNITSKGGIWVTEFAFPGQDMPTTQAFFNQSITYLDSQDVIKRYSYFGSFESSNSNVGPNVAMLDKNGHLTTIGAQYVGTGTASAAIQTRASWAGVSIAAVAAAACCFL